ncbi:hypothetical protein Tco_0219103 [Tanacetum coccineum]
MMRRAGYPRNVMDLKLEPGESLRNIQKHCCLIMCGRKQNDGGGEKKEVEKEKEVVEIVKETNVEDTSAKKNIEVVTEEEVVDMSGSQEIRKEQKQTPIPSPIRSPRNDLSSDFADTIVPELTVTNTNEMLKKEMPRLVKLAVNEDREVSPVDISGMVFKEFAAHRPKLIEELFRKHMQNITLNLYPKIKSSTATTSSFDLQQELYLSMKTKRQDQAVDLEIWEIVKAKFKSHNFHIS